MHGTFTLEGNEDGSFTLRYKRRGKGNKHYTINLPRELVLMILQKRETKTEE